MNLEKQKLYHLREAKRIQNEMNNLGEEFAPNGIVRTILKVRVEQEKQRAKVLQ